MQAGRAAGVGRLFLLPADEAEAEAAPSGTALIDQGGLWTVRDRLLGLKK